MTVGESQTIYTRGFILLNIVLIAASGVMALFFQFHQYLLSLGIDPRWNGFLIGADAVAGIVLQPFLSPYLHLRNAKKWAVTGICIMIIALFLYGLATTTLTIACVRVVHGAGFTILLAALMTLFAFYIPAQRSGEAIGLVSVVRLIPYALIPPLAVYLAGRSFGFIALITSSAAFLTIFLVFLAFIKPVADLRHTNADSTGGGLSGLIEDLRSRPVKIILAVNLVFYSAYTIVFFFLKEFGSGRGIKNPGYFFTIAMIMMIVIRLGGSRYFDRVKKIPVVVACMAALAICHVLVYFTSSVTTFLIIAAMFGVLWGVGIPLMMALIFDISEPRFRGLNLNLSMVMMQGGFFAGPFIGGLVLVNWGYGMLFVSCGLMNAAGAVMLLMLQGTKNGMTDDRPVNVLSSMLHK